MEPAWNTSSEAFGRAAAWFVETAARVGDRWDAPGLGEWDVRALVGHTSRALLTVEAYVAKPADRAEVESAVRYYEAARAIAGGPAVTQRGRDAGEALGDDPVSAVTAIASRVVTLVQTCSGDELVTTIVGGMRLRDYLPTRTFELVVHTSDLASALGLPVTPPAVAARPTLRLATDLVDDARTGELLLALTGRRGLADGYSIL